MHFLQKARRDNILEIQRWISDLNKDKKTNEDEDIVIDRKALNRKCQMVLGMSNRTANDYINLILGEEL